MTSARGRGDRAVVEHTTGASARLRRIRLPAPRENASNTSHVSGWCQRRHDRMVELVENRTSLCRGIRTSCNTDRGERLRPTMNVERLPPKQRGRLTADGLRLAASGFGQIDALDPER